MLFRSVQHHIVPDLGDEADWGAIGEGFSDYLAASHRQRSEAGRQFEPAMVFNWDARFTDRTPRQLDDLRAALARSDGTALEETFSVARQARRAWADGKLK